MIRCFYPGGSHLVDRSPCAIHKQGTRNKQLALAVIARDKRCWSCGTTERLEAAHIIAKAAGGEDTMANLRAECFARNRTGRCK